MLIRRGTAVTWGWKISFSGSSNDEVWSRSRISTHKEQSCHILHQCYIARYVAQISASEGPWPLVGFRRSYARVGREVENQLNVDETQGNHGDSEARRVAWVAIKESTQMLDGIPDNRAVDYLTGRGDQDSHEGRDDKAERQGD
jgi:hypothetical protein